MIDTETEKYKIGVTRSNNFEKRKKELQTGNASEILVSKTFKSDYPFKLENILHCHFRR